MTTIKKLITSTCANYVDGMCVIKDRPCPLVHGATYRDHVIPASEFTCDYFETAVLPADKTLEAKYHGQETLSKKCKGCGTSFNSVSNRAVYCSDTCRKSARKKTHIKHNNKRG
ncbi:hypothetical protein COK01_26360 [Priestia megaterium]|uniref:cysteine-rich VLP protein n=1 Tax=Priestia megaterium TaxID=1404 RepID=UPI000BF8A52B|nr:cysteine-rich VLP protein [Priestia megaterium]PFP44841.1 hypothetical protein COK01_26360 [Priestia megaterium]